MIKEFLKRIFAPIQPPVFPEDEEKSRKARYVNWISLALIIGIPAYEIITRLAGLNNSISVLDYVMLVIAASSALSFGLLRSSRVTYAAVLLVVGFWAGSNGLAASGYGLRDSSFIINFTIIFITAILLGAHASIIIGVMSIASAIGLAYAQNTGWIVPGEYSVNFFVWDISIILALTIWLVYRLVRDLENAINRSRTSLKELEISNAELNRTQSDLSAQSEELIETNAMLQNRTERLRAVAEVARTAASVQNFEQLLPLLTTIISKQLGFYHAGIFLLDEDREYAILRSANTDGGLRMLARGHRLKVGEQGIVGFVTQTGNPRIALDVGKDAVFFNNPDLPETRSELALPLKVSGEVIGALDLQSVDPNAFDDDAVSLLTILADQVAIAIQNAISSEQARRSLREAEIASGQVTNMLWKGYQEALKTKGYRYDGIKSEALKEPSRSTKENEGLLVPVQLRGQMIGRLKLRPSDQSHEWTVDEMAIIEATAERVALALEGARLLEDAQKRAARETFLSELGTKLGASFQLDSILRDTVEELGQTLKGSTVSFQLVNPSAPYTGMNDES